MNIIAWKIVCYDINNEEHILENIPNGLAQSIDDIITEEFEQKPEPKERGVVMPGQKFFCDVYYAGEDGYSEYLILENKTKKPIKTEVNFMFDDAEYGMLSEQIPRPANPNFISFVSVEDAKDDFYSDIAENVGFTKEEYDSCFDANSEQEVIDNFNTILRGAK